MGDSSVVKKKGVKNDSKTSWVNTYKRELLIPEMAKTGGEKCGLRSGVSFYNIIEI
jgi:hypothetical protein